jgi:hypothetical protein
MTPFDFWFDFSVKMAVEFWFLPYKIIGGNA